MTLIQRFNLSNFKQVWRERKYEKYIKWKPREPQTFPGEIFLLNIVGGKYHKYYSKVLSGNIGPEFKGKTTYFSEYSTS